MQIRTAQSCAVDPREAVRDFREGVAQADTGLVVFFCSPEYDLEVVAAEMSRAFPGVTVVGCTTAGQFGPVGYRDFGLSGASFSSRAANAVAGLLPTLRDFEMARGRRYAQDLLQELEQRSAHVTPENTFGFLLIDGLSVREEPVTCSLQHALGSIPMFGGSAGDDLRFGRTLVYHDGRFHEDSAILLLVSTTLPFRIFKTQHFVSTDERMVVTDADAEKRIVREINGMPAADEYARLIGARVEDLNPMRFAASPVVVLIDGVEYVRSIQKANPDGSLTFYCAIEEGLVLRVARGVDMMANLEHAFIEVAREIGTPQVVFGCDCVLRKLEIVHYNLQDEVARILTRFNVVGFNTYGEQYGGVHVNQTFTGIAIGRHGDGQDE